MIDWLYCDKCCIQKFLSYTAVASTPIHAFLEFFSPLTHYHTIPHSDTLKIYSCGKHCEKRKNCLLQAIFPFLTMFSTLYGTYFPFKMHFKMSSVICFHLDQSKILLSGNRLKCLHYFSCLCSQGRSRSGCTKCAAWYLIYTVRFPEALDTKATMNLQLFESYFKHEIFCRVYSAL